ncbi:hypothetical protein G4481_03360 [Fusicatenibacter saccharivorans]|uniref:hypothetical protein n=1 Tax=Fusicatenibacter saccharivorans TaxID=1150298 RepID=UPI00156E83B2|nr:hypothetical protein [Fusicatenibacter saccharivorans]NSD63410.1 hypothetical protein [Fusicatenibacter saccharivorans]
METKIIAVFVIVFLMMGLVEFVAAVYVVIKSRNLPEQKEREDMEQIEYLKTYQKKQQEKRMRRNARKIHRKLRRRSLCTRIHGNKKNQNKAKGHDETPKADQR